MKIHSNEKFFIENPIISINKFFHANDVVDTHVHSRAQLVYADVGVMELYLQGRYWLLPPLKGLWIPAYCQHRMLAKTDVHLKTLYIHVEPQPLQLPQQVTGIAVSPLLKELLIRAASIPLNYVDNSFEQRLLQLTLEEILHCQKPVLNLPIGQDPRIQQLCQYLLQHPQDERSLEEWSEQVGASPRTLMRLFKKELGIGFSLWKEQLKVMHAVQLLVEGKSLSYIASHLGYATQSAFSVMFKRVTGMTPTQYSKMSLLQ